MTEEPKRDIGNQKRSNWLRRWLQRGREKSGSDTIVAQIGKEAHHVAVGKNIIQIGTLQLPLSLVATLGFGVIVGISTLLWIALSANRISGVITASTQTPTVTPTATSTATQTPTPIPTPVVMPSSTYNIAVSKLIALDTAGQPVANEEAFDRGTSIVAYLNGETALIEQIRHATGQQPTIWGPDQHIPMITASQSVEQATALHAKLMIYGYLRQVSVTVWQLEPSFYIASDSLSFEGNLFGEYSFSTPIQYSPTDQASLHDLTAKLENLLRTLTFLIVGVSYYEHSNTSDYCQAAILFQAAAGRGQQEQTALIQDCPPGFAAQQNTDTINPTSEQAQEQAIANLFLGNTYLQLAFMAAKEAKGPAHVTQLLQMARTAYETGKSLAPELARFYSGLGQVAYNEARLQQKPGSWLEEDCQDIDFAKLEVARRLFADTLDRINNQSSNNNTPNANLHTATIAQLGLGRVYELLYRCDKNALVDHFKQSQQQYTSIIATYTQQPKFYMLKTVVYAYIELGSLLLWRSTSQNLTEAEGEQVAKQGEAYMGKAYKLAQSVHSDALLKDIQSNTIVCQVLVCQ